MHSCILSNKHDQALQMFQTLFEGNLPVLSEFYPGGEEHQISPLCRDLAMRAFEDSLHEGGSSQAVKLLQKTRDDELTVSFQAIRGVLSACERDKNWKDATSIFLQCINAELCLVEGSSLDIPTVDDFIEQGNPARSNVDWGSILSIVMRTCNAASQSGMSLMCLMLADKAPSGSLVSFEETALFKDHGHSGPFEQSILPFVLHAQNSDELLSATLAALLVLAHGLAECLDRDNLPPWFFISELGMGAHSERFTTTLLAFGLLMLPLFSTFVTGYRSYVPGDAARFAIGGWLSVCGIIGVGVWNLRHPLHYVSILLWLAALSTILDRYIPTPRGLVRLNFPTWVLKICMVSYLVSMVLLPFDGRVFCVISQRAVVTANIAWLLFLWKIVAAEALGLGAVVNGRAEELSR